MPESSQDAAFATLRAAYPWPSHPRFPDEERIGRKVRGFELIEDAIRGVGSESPVVLEVGAEFGSSTRRSLAIPGVRVVSVDPWPDSYRFRSWPELRAKYAGQERAMYDLFLSFNFEYRDRLVAVREFSPGGVRIVYDAGIQPDVVYLDADHQYESIYDDLTVASLLFPNAVLTGDDWNYNLKLRRLEGIELPVQTAVRRWAQHHDVGIVRQRNQWLIDRTQNYNMERVSPIFGRSGAKKKPGGKRVAALEKKQTELGKRQREPDSHLDELTPRLAREVRRRLGQRPHGKGRAR